MNLELNNPSAFHALRVSSQARARNLVDKAPAAPAPKRTHSREELQKIGSDILMVPSKGTAREADGMLRSVTREVPTPFFRTAGYDSLAEFITDQMEKGLRESQHAAAAITTAPRGERVVDTWGALQDKMSIPPGGKAVLNLEEHTRLAVACDEPGGVTLQISNTSTSRTLRLRTLDTASGVSTPVAFIPAAKDWPSAAIVPASAKNLAVIELMPS